MGSSMSDQEEYEVFAQFGEDGTLENVGSVRATDDVLAWHAAKEAYTRREDCKVLWVVPRFAIVVSTDDDRVVLAAGTRADWRSPAFPSRHRRQREKELGAKDADGDVTEDAAVVSAHD